MSKAHEETGFVPIKNYLLENIYQSDLTLTQIKLILCLARFTYGWKETGRSKRRKDRVRASITTLAQSCGLTPAHAKRGFRELVKRKIVIVHQEPAARQPGEYGINSDPDQWLGKDGKKQALQRDQSRSPRGINHDPPQRDQSRSPRGINHDPPEGTNAIPLEGSNAIPLMERQPNSHKASRTPKEINKERSKEIPPISPTGEAVDTNGIKPDLSDPEEVRKMELADKEAFALAGHFLTTTFAAIPSPTMTEQLQAYLADPTPNGYKLAVLVKSTQDLVRQRAELKANGKGRYCARRPIEQAISAAGERLAANKLAHLAKRKQSQSRATQPGIGESETLENYKRRIGAI